MAGKLFDLAGEIVPGVIRRCCWHGCVSRVILNENLQRIDSNGSWLCQIEAAGVRDGARRPMLCSWPEKTTCATETKEDNGVVLLQSRGVERDKNLAETMA